MTIVVNPNSNIASVNHNGGSSPITLSFTSLPTAGNSVFIFFFNRNTPTNIISSITDNQGVGNTYSAVVTAQSIGVTDTELWWCPSIGATSGTFTVSLTMSAGSAPQCNTGILEASGVASTIDQTGISVTSAGVSSLTPTAAGANTNANDLVICGGGNATAGATNAWSLTSGYTTWFSFDGASFNAANIAGYKVLSGLETSSGTISWTSGANQGGSVIATFNPIPPANPSYYIGSQNWF